MRWISLQLKVINSPFNQEQAELLNRILPTLTETQKVWLCGYLAASQSYSVPQTPEALVPELQAERTGQTISKAVIILYGSQTGNAEGLAVSKGKTLEARFSCNGLIDERF